MSTKKNGDPRSKKMTFLRGMYTVRELRQFRSGEFP
nr:MAG TPA: hypothetical protein [Caudoviricetes sp.]